MAVVTYKAINECYFRSQFFKVGDTMVLLPGEKASHHFVEDTVFDAQEKAATHADQLRKTREAAGEPALPVEPIIRNDAISLEEIRERAELGEPGHPIPTAKEVMAKVAEEDAAKAGDKAAASDFFGEPVNTEGDNSI